MIIALVLADQTGPLIRGTLPYLLPVGDETVIERASRAWCCAGPSAQP